MNVSEELGESKKFQLFHPDETVKICSIVESMLIARNLNKILPLVQTAIIELVMNSFKAYDKRAFFLQNELSLDSDYEEGMKLFKKKFHEEQDGNENILRSKPVYLEFHISNKELYLLVKTDIQMHQEEERVVTDLLKRRIEENDLMESEGGGIGIHMILAILENLNLNRSCFSFHTEPEKTSFSLSLVLSDLPSFRSE